MNTREAEAVDRSHALYSTFYCVARCLNLANATASVIRSVVQTGSPVRACERVSYCSLWRGGGSHMIRSPVMPQPEQQKVQPGLHPSPWQSHTTLRSVLGTPPIHMHTSSGFFVLSKDV